MPDRQIGLRKILGGLPISPSNFIPLIFALGVVALAGVAGADGVKDRGIGPTLVQLVAPADPTALTEQAREYWFELIVLERLLLDENFRIDRWHISPTVLMKGGTENDLQQVEALSEINAIIAVSGVVFSRIESGEPSITIFFATDEEMAELFPGEFDQCLLSRTAGFAKLDFEGFPKSGLVFVESSLTGADRSHVIFH